MRRKNRRRRSNPRGFLYRLYSYDVWGNARDGFEVNDKFSTGTTLRIRNSDSDKSIVRKLKRAGFLNKYVKDRSIEIDGEPGYVFYLTYAPTGYPLGELQADS